MFYILFATGKRLRDTSEGVSRSTSFVVRPTRCPHQISNWSARNSPNACPHAHSHTHRLQHLRDPWSVVHSHGLSLTLMIPFRQPVMMKIYVSVDKPSALVVTPATGNFHLTQEYLRLPPHQLTPTRWHLLVVIEPHHPRLTVQPDGHHPSESSSDVCPLRDQWTNLKQTFWK